MRFLTARFPGARAVRNRTYDSLLLVNPFWARLSLIEGWPVQFLPAFNPLLEEALINAVEVAYGAIRTRVFTAEYLAAIMLYTGRMKDHTRLLQLLTEGTVNHTALHDIIVQHDLGAKWESFKRRFLDTGVEKSN